MQCCVVTSAFYVCFSRPIVRVLTLAKVTDVLFIFLYLNFFYLLSIYCLVIIIYYIITNNLLFNDKHGRQSFQPHRWPSVSTTEEGQMLNY